MNVFILSDTNYINRYVLLFLISIYIDYSQISTVFPCLFALFLFLSFFFGAIFLFSVLFPHRDHDPSSDNDTKANDSSLSRSSSWKVTTRT